MIVIRCPQHGEMVVVEEELGTYSIRRVPGYGKMITYFCPVYAPNSGRWCELPCEEVHSVEYPEIK